MVDLPQGTADIQRFMTSGRRATPTTGSPSMVTGAVPEQVAAYSLVASGAGRGPGTSLIRPC